MPDLVGYGVGVVSLGPNKDQVAPFCELVEFLRITWIRECSGLLV